MGVGPKLRAPEPLYLRRCQGDAVQRKQPVQSCPQRLFRLTVPLRQPHAHLLHLHQQ